MAKINAGEVGRIDVATVFPEFLLCADADNSRSVPHTEDEIKALADSILEHGQLQPCVGRRVADNKVQVVAGFGRCKAVAYINQYLRPDRPMKVLIRVTDMNSEEAFVRSIAENIERAATTPIDDAHAQRRLRDDFGWTDVRIAEFYKKSVSYIAQLRKTLQLSTELKAEVASGTLPLSTAVVLTELPEQERKEVVAEARQSDGKVSTEQVKKAVRKRKKAKGKKSGVRRSLKEVRAFFTGLSGPAEPESVRRLANGVLDFIAGRLDEEELESMVKAAAGVEEAEAAMSH